MPSKLYTSIHGLIYIIQNNINQFVAQNIFPILLLNGIE